MKKQTIAIIFVLALMTALFSGCGQTTASIAAPDWDTTAVTTNGFSYEMPADWKTVEDTSGQGAIIYVPADADLNAGTSSVNLIINKTGEKAVSLKAMKESLETSLASQLTANGFDSVENMKISDLSSPVGEVCMITYDVSISGVTLSQTQYYPLIDNYIVVITATDIGDDITPAVEEVAEHVAMTIKAA